LFFQQSCFHSSIGVHVEKMIFKLDRWLSFDFHLPPLPEQQKIAEILSTWDKAIETTEALLVNARSQKRALMQSLLTGTGRFPGVSGREWEKGTLSTIADIHMGQSPAGETYNSDGVGAPLINGPTEFTDRHPVTRQWTTQPTKMCKAGDVLVCVRGSSTGRMNIADQSYCIGRGVAAVRKRPGKADMVYLQQLLKSLVEMVLSRAAGSTFPNIDKKSMNEIEVMIPPIAAQVRIGEALACADDDVENIEMELDYLRTEKKSLMQQLLTGKRRVMA
jgi:type I restriction enzyme S subunit